MRSENEIKAKRKVLIKERVRIREEINASKTNSDICNDILNRNEIEVEIIDWVLNKQIKK